jgi:hypothetical protein
MKKIAAQDTIGDISIILECEDDEGSYSDGDGDGDNDTKLYTVVVVRNDRKGGKTLERLEYLDDEGGARAEYNMLRGLLNKVVVVRS